MVRIGTDPASQSGVNLVIRWLRVGVSDASSDSQPSTLAEALNIKRNVVVGLAVGVGVAVVAYAVRVFELFGPVVTTREYPVIGPEGWFLMLAIVFASATALLVILVLTGLRVARLAKES